VYLPLPTLDHQLPAPLSDAQSVLLWIADHDRPAAEIVEIAERQGLAIRRLQAGDDLNSALVGVQPAAIAWDLPNGGAGEWALVQGLRVHPQLCHLPFILYSAGRLDTPTLGMTGLVIKPVSGQTLQDIIHAMCLAQAGGTILIVDDDPQALDLYSNVAANAMPDRPIQTAGDGAAALQIMAEATPAAVVLDLTMPGVDGFQVLDWMRANPRTRRVPVLVLSGRILTNEDIKRLEQHARVTLQSKDILSEGETAAALRQVVSGAAPLAQPTSALVKRTIAYLQQHYQRPLSRQEIAQAIGVTENYLSRIFRQELALSPWGYLNRYRIKQAKDLLRSTNASVTAIATQVGFDNPAYFARVFHDQVGVSPRAYRENPSG
jgi:AraC-like DNA-binding protein